MKRLNQLGISPTPWTTHEWCQPDDIGSEVRDATGRPIIDTFDLSFYPQSHANCVFLAASPDLYDALLNLVKLHEDCSKNYCDECPRCLGNGRKCDIEEDELIEAAYRALAKAAGEEVRP